MIRQRFKSLADWFRRSVSNLIKQAIVVYLIAKDTRVSRAVRYLAVAVVVYAFSPIDLIPDFIPILGLLDDLILIPAGVWLVLYFTPEKVIQSARQRATLIGNRPVSRVGAAIFVLIWLAIAIVVYRSIKKLW